MLLEASAEALATLFTIERLSYMSLGVAIGLIIGVLPGLGGTVGMSILLPFIFGMDPGSGVALLIGFIAVGATSDTFPAVLLGVPGSAGSQATVMDGYPLAKQGQAARALGASFTASITGGLIGAIALLSVLFFGRELILALGSPQLFMLSVLGLSMVAILSKGAPLPGLIAASLGLLIGSIGVAPAHATYRFTFDWPYLFSGVPLPVVALGLFAIPEMIDLVARNRAVSSTTKLEGSLLSGMREAASHRFLLFRSSLIGTGVGFIPGLGGTVTDWIAYGLAERTCKDSSRFGKGDIRGVIAPEAANNAKEGGALIPTLLFGIPGSGTTAMLLGGLMLMGIQPGPRMLTTHLDVTLATIWTLVIANMMAGIVCLVLAHQIAKLSLVPAKLLFPFLLAVMAAAAFQSTRHWGDLAWFVAIGFLGYLMKVAEWPRPPVLIGFVLAPSAERYLHLSMSRYGLEWLTFPSVMAIGLFVLFIVFGSMIRERSVILSASDVKSES